MAVRPVRGVVVPVVGGSARRRGRLRRAATYLAAMTVTVGLLPAVPAFAGPASPSSGAPTPKSVPVGKVRPASRPAAAQAAAWKPGGHTLPAGGGADVPVAAVDAPPTAVTPVPVGGLPVKVRSAVPAEPRSQSGMRRMLSGGSSVASPAAVHVDVASAAAAAKAGLAGVLFTLSPADGGGVGGKVDVDVDYSGFKDLYGANFGARLRLVSLPACVLTTPERPECRVQTPVADAQNREQSAVVSAAGLTVGSSSDTTASPATADAAPGASGVGSTPAGGPAGDAIPDGQLKNWKPSTTKGERGPQKSAPTSGGQVYALASTDSSSSGSYRATSLSPTYSWAAGDQGGDFTYNYPIQVPASLGGPAPELTLQYSSGSVDGRTTAANGQTSWVGEGWDLQTGYIERTYKPCADDGQNTGDLCSYAEKNATLVLGGRSTRLVKDDATGTWHTEDDNGWKVEQLFDTTLVNGDYFGEYWRLTDPSGTQYQFGRNLRFNGDSPTNSVQHTLVYGNNPGEPCHNNTYAWWSGCDRGYRWNLDYVIDARGNSMTYFYEKYSGKYGNWNGSDVHAYDLTARLDHIDYGTRAGQEGSGPAPMRVDFSRNTRCTGDGCTVWPDVPWDKYCSLQATTCATTSPLYFSPFKLQNITTKVWNAQTGAYQAVDQYTMNTSWPDPGDGTAASLWLDSIVHTGVSGSGATATAPVVSFDKTWMDNRLDWVANQVPPLRHYRIGGVNNGTGEHLTVDYSTKQCDASTPPAWDNNPLRCFAQYFSPAPGNYGIGYFNKYVVLDVVASDTTGGSPDEVWYYDYSTTHSTSAALWHFDDNEVTDVSHRMWSDWRGYTDVKVTHGPVSGPQTVTTSLYYRGMNGDRVGSTDNARSAAINDSKGNALLDQAPLRGFQRETDQIIPGSSHIAVETFHSPTLIKTGTRSAPWTSGTFSSNILREWATDTYTWIQAANTERDAQVRRSFDGYGLPVEVDDYGDANVTGDETCTHTDYARNTANGTYLIDFPSQVTTTDCTSSSVGQVSGGYPMSGTGGSWAGAKLITGGDFNGDGKADIAAILGDGNLYLYAGDGAGKLATGVPMWGTDGTWGNAQLMTAGDFNGDGKTDIAVVFGGNLYLYAGDGAGHLSGGVPMWATDGTWGTSKLITAGDFNGDGKTDIARIDGSGNLYLYPGDGAGKLASRVAMWSTDGSWGGAQAITGGDFNGDGKIDIAAIFSGNMYLYAGNGAGQLSNSGLMWPSGGQWANFHGITAGDFNGDGRVDVAGIDANNDMRLYPGSGAGGNYLAGSQTLYDGATTVGAAPSKGLATKTNALASFSGTTTVWKQAGRTDYDVYGRPTAAYDALDRKTATAYTPATGGPVTATAVTNPAGWTATTTLDPGLGVPTKVVDANGKTTNAVYDPLGRLTKVWLNNRPTSATPDLAYTYTLQSGVASWVQTQKLSPTGQQISSYAIYDGRLRLRQTQTPAPQSVGGRVITDTAYDGRGLTAKTSTFWNNTSGPTGTLVAFSDADVANQHRFSYDNLERRTVDALYSNNTYKWQTSTAYDGDRTTVTPPPGGIATTTLVDARGRTVTLRQYRGDKPSGTYQDTSYGYDRLGRQTSVTDPAGNKWTTSYDLRGRAVQTTDPDKGTVNSGYDDAAELTSTKDARGTTLAYKYDNLGRKTELWQNAIGTGTQLAKWTYDTLDSGTVVKGQPATSTQYTNGNAYTTLVTGYDDAYRPLGATVRIPAAETGLAGDWTTTTSYNVDGSVASTTYPAAAGLGAETVATRYDNVGFPVGLTGLDTYIADTQYTYWGAIKQQMLGTAPKQVKLTTGLDEATGRLTQLSTATQTDATTYAEKLTENYNYNPAGQVRSITETNADTLESNQCFNYDALQELTDAWTTTATTCQATPSQSIVGGPDPYWNSYRYDAVGNRTGDTTHASTGDTTRSYSYTGKPHTVTSITMTGATTGTSSYAYDNTGNTTTRNVTGQPGQTLTWDPEGHLATLTDSTGTASYLYDASGNRLIAHDATGTTLYLGSTEVHRDTTGAISATRFYGSAAVRTDPGGLTWLAADNHGTGELAINASDLSVTRRKTDPFGNPRGTQAAWPTTHGYVNGVTDPTGLTHLSAREYDPTTGRFISVDPILDVTDPQQMNGYSYANNNPTTGSDPTGLKNCSGPDDCDPLDFSGNPGHGSDPGGCNSPSACGAPSGAAGGTSGDGNSPRNNPIVRISPHVVIHKDDPAYSRLSAAWGKYSKSYDYGKWYGVSEEFVWASICGFERDLCPEAFSGMFGKVHSSFSDSEFKKATSGGANLILGTAGASGGYVRSLLDPKSMVGVSEEELRAMVPKDWVEQPLKKGDGIKLGTRPNSKGQNFGSRGWAEYNRGDPNAPDSLHQSDFVRVSSGGLRYRVAAEGNPVIEDPEISSIQGAELGDPGPGLDGASDILPPEIPIP